MWYDPFLNPVSRNCAKGRKKILPLKGTPEHPYPDRTVFSSSDRCVVVVVVVVAVAVACCCCCVVVVAAAVVVVEWLCNSKRIIFDKKG